MTVDAIKHAIEDLSEPEFSQLGSWIDELREQAWDRQIAVDSAPGGAAEALIERLDREIDARRFGSLREGFLARRGD